MKKVWLSMVFVGLCLTMLFGFQNCGPANLAVSNPATANGESPSSDNVGAPAPTPTVTPPLAPSGPVAIKACQASAARSDGPCTNAYDGNKASIWSAGTNQAWIEVDLGSVQTVSRIVLTVTQSPSGNTSHSLYHGTAQAPGILLQTFAQFTDDNSVLTWSGPSIQARYLRIQTTQNPSWTAWREIEVFH